MESTFSWKPEPALLQKLINLAESTGQAPEEIVTEAVKLYLDKQSEKPVIEKIVLSERDWDIMVSALENPPEAPEALKVAIKEHQDKYGKW
ncbi:hypothetical protein DSM106972_022240 [Dulcicalothrix desertica PCC 7102]|uniref:DUF1778 domain-containing protein n=1 Tax=Dulcicalothrix desertica PCC 7102 TaxID=232991 RepID=A0A3S1J5C7_9CYAN|nr:DUF1778 domain-containing protein [Dulcicalothrix desertica]RUT07964.1 hypothetical protein DSM106972_022240 [Dulcicalothrix desertica PCC 7102]TWH39485.1 uncharacterized protein DUF1778 [Dulcicalothrix desertica PCC 7102]